jgi:hypothetical protein
MSENKKGHLLGGLFVSFKKSYSFTTLMFLLWLPAVAFTM